MDGIKLNFDIELKWQVTRGRHKPFIFAIFSALTALGLVGLNIAAKDISIITFSMENLIVAIISLLAISIGSGLLYHLFDKK